MPNPNCPECKGTGKYHGLNEVTDCKTCIDAALKSNMPGYVEEIPAGRPYKDQPKFINPPGYIPAGPNGRNATPKNDFDDFLMDRVAVERFANQYAVDFYRTLGPVIRCPGSIVNFPVIRHTPINLDMNATPNIMDRSFHSVQGYWTSWEFSINEKIKKGKRPMQAFQWALDSGLGSIWETNKLDRHRNGTAIVLPEGKFITYRPEYGLQFFVLVFGCWR